MVVPVHSEPKNSTYPYNGVLPLEWMFSSHACLVFWSQRLVLWYVSLCGGSKSLEQMSLKLYRVEPQSLWKLYKTSLALLNLNPKLLLFPSNSHSSLPEVRNFTFFCQSPLVESSYSKECAVTIHLLTFSSNFGKFNILIIFDFSWILLMTLEYNQLSFWIIS